MSFLTAPDESFRSASDFDLSFFTGVAEVRARNKTRKKLEKLLGIMSGLVVLFVALRLQSNVFMMFTQAINSISAFLITVCSIGVILCIIQLIKVNSFLPLRISERQKKLAKVEDDEEGFSRIASDVSVKSDDKEGFNFLNILASSLPWSSLSLSDTDSCSYSSLKGFASSSPRMRQCRTASDDDQEFNRSSEELINMITDKIQNEVVESSAMKECMPCDVQAKSYMTAVPSPPLASEIERTKPEKIIIWSKFNIERSNISGWRENFRKWISQTIVNPLVNEIDKLNETLKSHGVHDVTIGEDTVDRLRATASAVLLDAPSFRLVLPYLEITNNQTYLVKRLKELSFLCLSRYRWNGGGTFEGREWSELFPTDSAILFHLFCTYMDSMLPPSALYLDGKTFSNKFTRKYSSKPAALTGNYPIIVNSSELPPVYKLVYNGEILNAPSGQYNLFDVILGFLYVIKIDFAGTLGSVSLGDSGVNILWVIS